MIEKIRKARESVLENPNPRARLERLFAALEPLARSRTFGRSVSMSFPDVANAPTEQLYDFLLQSLRLSEVRMELGLFIDESAKTVSADTREGCEAKERYYPCVNIGFGIYGQILNTGVVGMNGANDMLTIDAKPRIGGLFADGTLPVFNLNNRLRPENGKSTALPGTLDNILPLGESSPFQFPDITRDTYPSQDMLGFLLKLNGYLTADSYLLDTKVTSIERTGLESPRYRVFFSSEENPKAISVTTDFVNICDGVGVSKNGFEDRTDYGTAEIVAEEESRPLNERTYFNFTDFIRYVGNDFEGSWVESFAGEGLVIGPGDSGKVAIECILGYGPNKTGTARRGFTSKVNWLGQFAQTGDDYCDANRARYSILRGEFPRGSGTPDVVEAGLAELIETFPRSLGNLRNPEDALRDVLDFLDGTDLFSEDEFRAIRMALSFKNAYDYRSSLEIEQGEDQEYASYSRTARSILEKYAPAGDIPYYFTNPNGRRTSLASDRDARYEEGRKIRTVAAELWTFLLEKIVPLAADYYRRAPDAFNQFFGVDEIAEVKSDNSPYRINPIGLPARVIDERSVPANTLIDGTKIARALRMRRTGDGRLAVAYLDQFGRETEKIVDWVLDTSGYQKKTDRLVSEIDMLEEDFDGQVRSLRINDILQGEYAAFKILDVSSSGEKTALELEIRQDGNILGPIKIFCDFQKNEVRTVEADTYVEYSREFITTLKSCRRVFRSVEMQRRNIESDDPEILLPIAQELASAEGIRLVGPTTGIPLTDRERGVDALRKVTENLASIFRFGPVVSEYAKKQAAELRGLKARL